MIRSITQFALLVLDYDEAKNFYCGKLGFKLLEDTQLEAKRWVRLGAPGGQGAEILLSKVTTDQERAIVGNQAGGRVLFFLRSDHFDADYGNRIDLIEPNN